MVHVFKSPIYRVTFDTVSIILLGLFTLAIKNALGCIHNARNNICNKHRIIMSSDESH